MVIMEHPPVWDRPMFRVGPGDHECGDNRNGPAPEGTGPFRVN